MDVIQRVVELEESKTIYTQLEINFDPPKFLKIFKYISPGQIMQ